MEMGVGFLRLRCTVNKDVGALSTEQTLMDREHQKLIHAHKKREKSHENLQKRFKLQNDAMEIIRGVGGKEHVRKINAVTKLTKVLQYGYGGKYNEHIDKSNFKKVALDALSALNTEKSWPDIMEDPGNFCDSTPPRPDYEKSSIARERERNKRATLMVARENPEYVVKNLNQAQRRALLKSINDMDCNDAASAHADTENSDAPLPL